MPDAFFSKPRPFTKRKRDDAPGRDSSARSGSSRGGRGGSRGGRGGAGARGGRGGARSGGADRDASKGKRRERDEELDDGDVAGGAFDSDEEEVEGEGEDYSGSEASDDELETPAQKRLRLAQMYLESLEKDKPKDDGIGFDAADLDRDLIAERLQKDVLEHSGKLHVHVGARVLPIPATAIYHTPSRSHRGPLTAAVASSDANWLYTSSKDGSIIKWDLRQLPSASTSTARASADPAARARITKAAFLTKRILEKPAKGEEKGKGKETAEGHTDQVLTLALSDDGKVLASGGADKVVGAWDVQGEGASWLRGLGGHKDKVASIAFRQGTQQLYSSSFDRTIKLFDLSTLSYVETLFGHQDSIQGVAALRAELCVSAGGRDKTVRFWKVTEESQLVFRGGVASRIRNVLDGGLEDDGIEPDELKKRRAARGKAGFVEGSVDVVAMVDDSTFLSGGDSGSICLWTTTKKKPIATQSLAHGVDEHASESEGVIGVARWITALACLPYGDTFASGSWDGEVRLWKIDDRLRSFSQIATIPALGFVNSVQLIAPSLKPRTGRDAEDDAREQTLVVVAGVAKEPRLGRWMRVKEGREGAVVAVVPLGPEK